MEQRSGRSVCYKIERVACVCYNNIARHESLQLNICVGWCSMGSCIPSGVLFFLCCKGCYCRSTLGKALVDNKIVLCNVLMVMYAKCGASISSVLVLYGLSSLIGEILQVLPPIYLP